MPLFWLSLAFVLGIALAAAVDLPPAAWLIPAAIIALAAFIERRIHDPRYTAARRFFRLPLALLPAAVLLGAGRMALAQPAFTPADLAFYNGRGEAVMEGAVAAAPDRRDRATQVRVAVDTITFEGEAAIPVSGLALLRLPGGYDLAYGDRVQVTGSPVAPPEVEGFSYRAYLARRGIHTYLAYPRVQRTGSGPAHPLWQAVYTLRQRAYDFIQRAYPQPESALLAGILLGLERDFPPELELAYQDTGTAHIIAISGFNMAILAALFLTLFGRVLPKGPASLAAVAAIAFYTLLVGSNPAVVRAAIMGAAGVFGAYLGRRQTAVNSLAFTAAAMCLFNPHLPWDASFQFSFAATLGLVLYAGRMDAAFGRWADARLPEGWSRRLRGPLSEYVLATLAAQVTTLPVVAYHFQRLSPVMLVANPLVLPPQPLLMVLGGLSTLAGLVWEPAGQALAALAWLPAAYTNGMVAWLASWSLRPLTLNAIPPGLVLALYTILFALTLTPRFRPALARSLRPAAVLTALALLAGFTWRAALAQPDGMLHLAVIGIDGGPALLVQSPEGQTALIGGAASANRLSDVLGRRLPPTGRSLDAAVIHKPAAAGLEGLPVTYARFPPARVWWAVSPPERAAARRIADTLTEMRVDWARLEEGAGLALGDQVTLRVLSAEEDGAAVLLTMDRLRVFAPGGVPPARLGPAAQGISLLVLGPADLEATDVSSWRSLGAQAVAVLADPVADLPPEWIDLRRAPLLDLTSDGKTMWLAQGER